MSNSQLDPKFAAFIVSATQAAEENQTVIDGALKAYNETKKELTKKLQSRQNGLNVVRDQLKAAEKAFADEIDASEALAVQKANDVLTKHGAKPIESFTQLSQRKADEVATVSLASVGFGAGKIATVAKGIGTRFMAGVKVAMQTK